MTFVIIHTARASVSTSASGWQTSSPRSPHTFGSTSSVGIRNKPCRAAARIVERMPAPNARGYKFVVGLKPHAHTVRI